MFEKNKFTYTEGFTHGGTFHADDVFSTALLKKLNPHIRITRGFEIPENFKGIVYDIGLGKFDHHQLDNEVRPNGIPYASFGKLWREYGRNFFPEDLCKQFDFSFVSFIDNCDNTGEKDSVSTVISSMNPVWDSEKTYEEKFEEAVKFASYILDIQFEQLRAKIRARNIIENKIRKVQNGILILDRYMPYQENAIRNKKVKFVIFPSNRGGYNICTVPKMFNCKESRIPFPEKWLGKEKEELNGYVEGMFFCHKSNFMASAETLEQAKNVAKEAKRLFDERKIMEKNTEKNEELSKKK